MHIAVLCDPHSFHTQKWVSALKTAGAEVTVFSFEKSNTESFTSVYIPPVFTYRGKYTYLSYLFSHRRLRSALKKHKIDILNPINITPFGIWGLRSGFKPMVSVSMGADILEFPPNRSARDFPEARAWKAEQPDKFWKRVFYLIKWKIFRYWVNKTLHSSVFITGDNLVLINAIRDWFKVPEGKLFLNRWGVEPTLFKAEVSVIDRLRKKFQIKEGERVILSPRGMMPIYQGDIILDAFEQLIEAGMENIKFIMLSAGYQIPENILKKAHSLKEKSDNFLLVEGVLPREEVLLLWQLVDIMISAPVYDGYSNALGEARFAGVIPVVNDIPASRELIRHQHNGWVVEPFSSFNLSEALTEILDDMEKWKTQFRDVNRQWILENGMLEKNIRNFLQLCENALRK